MLLMTTEAFLEALKEGCGVEAKPQADWYLQTRIQQDKDGNMTLDQMRYSKAMVARFLPTFANEIPSKQDLKKCASPDRSVSADKIGFRGKRNPCSKISTKATNFWSQLV